VNDKPLQQGRPSFSEVRARSTWVPVYSPSGLDPGRYLGELRDLPRAAQPGDWCSLVVHDHEGEMRWTLVAVDSARTTSIFADRRDEDGGGDPAPRGARRTGSGRTGSASASAGLLASATGGEEVATAGFAADPADAPPPCARRPRGFRFASGRKQSLMRQMRTLLASMVLVSALAVPATAATSQGAAASSNGSLVADIAAGPPSVTLPDAASAPTVVCNPAWGTIVLPICV
jgi:hypothetical protein